MSRAPESLDGYTLIRELGRGGMGVVYEVHDPRLDRRLALKQVLGHEADAEAILRFRRESELLARINHPHVLRIHRVGTSPSGPYFVSELVEGEPLDQLTKRSGALPPEQAARLIRDLASATAALHASGVIHRDLKPGNVVLRPDGSPVLIDFGLASDPRAQRLTVTGTILGTPHYMSPEQALGESAIGPPSDVYALGAMHEGLAAIMVLDAIARGDTTWPPELRDQTPEVLVQISERARAMDPAARPSAADLARDLERYLEDPSAGALPGRLAPLLILAPLLVLVALAALWLSTSRGAPPASKPTATPSAPRPEPEATPVEVTAAILALRSPSSESFSHAEALLEEGRGEKLALLRLRYVEARLLAPPTAVYRGPELPAYGKATWFDARRLVVASEREAKFWCWEDWARPDRTDYSSTGDKKTRRTGPLVFEGRVYLGGGPSQAPQAEAYAWAQTPALQSLSTQAAIGCLAAARVAPGEALLAVGILSKLGRRQGTIQIFDLETGELKQTLGGHGAGIVGMEAQTTLAGSPGVSALSFSPDGRWLISGGLAGGVIVWDVTTWEPVASRVLGSGDIRDLACHPSRPLLAVSPGLGQRVHLLELPSLKEQAREPSFARADPESAAFSRDGRFLFAGGNASSGALLARDIRRGALIAYDLDTMRLVESRRFQLQAPRSLQLSPDGRRLAVYSRGPGSEGILQVWEIDVPPR